jgi:alanine racemase
MVGKLEEALSLRQGGVSCPVLNFGRFTPGDTEDIVRLGISQSVFESDVEDLSRTALKLGQRAKVHIHVDTGMGRMGISFRDVRPYIKKAANLKGIHIEGISTTLTEDDEFDQEQIHRLIKICGWAEKAGISTGLKHAASSDAVLDLPSALLDLVRPGILLYGYYPSEKARKEKQIPLKPVLEWKARVAAVKDLRRGDTLSYHRKYRAQKREKAAVVSAGYSDGYPAGAVEKASVIIRGKKYPLIAAITANHCLALLGNDPGVQTGDEVVLIGKQRDQSISAEDIAAWAGTSVYKILINLNPLLPRIACS